MTTIHSTDGLASADRFGRRVAARLSAGTAELPYALRERLRAARMQALAQRKPARLAGAPAVYGQRGGVTLTVGDDSPGLWTRIASALPLLALAAGLVLIYDVQSDRRAAEVAEVDAALLTDDLPPAAYADPGFVQFLRTGRP
jgi:hypothetical protein